MRPRNTLILSRCESGRVRRAAVLLFALLALSVPTVPSATAAESAPRTESLGVTPAEVQVPDAQRGESYLRQVSIQNEFDSPTRVTLELSGETGGWATTLPADALTVGPREHATLEVRLAVPDDAANGVHSGQLRVVAEAKQAPDGSGFALRYAVAIPLNVTVGGDQVVRMRWVDVQSPDVETGTPPSVVAAALNEGNVRTVARLRAELMPFASEEVLATAEGFTEVLPGARGEVRVAFDEALPEGQYRVRVQAEPASAAEPPRVLAFKVLPPGSLDKDGLLRYIAHEPRVVAGQPVKLSAMFENTGTTSIGRAKLVAEVYVDGVLVAVVESEPRVVGVGEQANLTAFYTPTSGGVHRIVGRVTYDGYEAMPSEGILTVRDDATSASPIRFHPVVLGAAGLVAALVVHQLVRRKRG